MKRRILNFNFPGTHESFKQLDDFNAAESVSDYHAFIFDPQALGAVQALAFFRRRQELRDLVRIKGGIVICVLRPSTYIQVQNAGNLPRYSLLEEIDHRATQMMQSQVKPGMGTQLRLVQNAKGAMNGYFRILKDRLSFEAFLDAPEGEITAVRGRVFAFDSVDHPVALEFTVDGGRVCYVPVPTGAAASPQQVGAAVFQVIATHFDGTDEIELPPWINEITVPGADANDEQIAKLERASEDIKAEINQLTEKRSSLLNYRRLLFGTGKSVLETIVREAFTLLGFTVPEPDTYQGEWDVELHDAPSKRTAIGEIEGAEGSVDYDKFRQLLTYIQDETLKGREHKGVLVGNGHRLTHPGAVERKNPFTEHAVKAATRFGMCLLPSAELYRAVCAVLESPRDETLKSLIRDSILDRVGIWTFESSTKRQDPATAIAILPVRDQ
jgi:hypothetical protein